MSQNLETRVEIAAPPEIVWEVLTDANAFPEWTENVRFSRALRAGESLPMRVRLFGRTLTVPVLLEMVDAPTELRWRGGPRGLFVGSHYFRLSPADGGGTTLRQGEDFRGLTVPVLFPLLRAEFLSLYRRIDADLEKRAQTMSGSQDRGIAEPSRSTGDDQRLALA